MTTGMHGMIAGSKGNRCFFFNRQGIHIRPQKNGLSRFLSLHSSYNSAFTDFFGFVSIFLQLLSDKCLCLWQEGSHFRVLMQSSADFCQFLLYIFCCFFHEFTIHFHRSLSIQKRYMVLLCPCTLNISTIFLQMQTASSNSFVYSACGCSNTASTVPCSRILPSFITITRSQI